MLPETTPFKSIISHYVYWTTLLKFLWLCNRHSIYRERERKRRKGSTMIVHNCFTCFCHYILGPWAVFSINYPVITIYVVTFPSPLSTSNCSSSISLKSFRQLYQFYNSRFSFYLLLLPLGTWYEFNMIVYSVCACVLLVYMANCILVIPVFVLINMTQASLVDRW